MITPFISQVILKSSFYAAVSIYAFCGALVILISLNLPVETAGTKLSDVNGKGEAVSDWQETNYTLVC